MELAPSKGMKLLAESLVLTGLLMSSFTALAGTAAESCALRPDGVLFSKDDSSPTELFCERGLPVKRLKRFAETGSVAQELSFRGGKAFELRIHSLDGRWTTLLRFTHLANGNVIKESFPVRDGRISAPQTKEELKNFDPEDTDVQLQSVLVRRWIFKTAAPSEIDHVAVYSEKNQKRIVVKEYYDAGGRYTGRILFTYKDGEEKPVRFQEFDAREKPVRELSLYEPFEPRKRLEKAGLPEPEIRRRLEHQKNPDRFLMAVIDGGFDYNHPELSWKWWNNPDDPVDGLDNDGNGWVDDQFGWEREKNTHLPTESSSSMTAFTRPDSHGTHVSHIATRNLENVALVGFAGDYTRAEYVDRISAFLLKHRVKVVNISIGLPQDNKDDLGLKNGIKAFERMIRANPETLFVVAAGNSGQDIDIYANRQYPASFTHPNVLKVGSVDADRLDPSRLRSYKMSDWSNFGRRTVDILAPGARVSAARLGGGMVVHSGTSMASPYMAREAARLWMRFPHLSATRVREIFIQSAAPLDERPAILSGGVVDFDAALRLARTGDLLNRATSVSGPNCWNAALYARGLVEGIRHVDGHEFTAWLSSPLCEEVPAEQAAAGDVVALRRATPEGKLVKGPYGSEVHGYLLADRGTGFTKNGTSAAERYQFEESASIFRNYLMINKKDCRMLGLPAELCQLKAQYFRCDPSKLSWDPRLAPLAEKVSELEHFLHGFYLNETPAPGDKDPFRREVRRRAELLRRDLATLESTGAPDWQIELLEARLSSATVFLF